MNFTFRRNVVPAPLVATGLEKACYSVQMAKACFWLVHPQEGELLITGLNERIEYIVDLFAIRGKKKKEGISRCDRFYIPSQTARFMQLRRRSIKAGFPPFSFSETSSMTYIFNSCCSQNVLLERCESANFFTTQVNNTNPNTSLTDTLSATSFLNQAVLKYLKWIFNSISQFLLGCHKEENMRERHLRLDHGII